MTTKRAWVFRKPRATPSRTNETTKRLFPHAVEIAKTVATNDTYESHIPQRPSIPPLKSKASVISGVEVVATPTTTMVDGVRGRGP